ncbi:polyprenyl synthetase family protein [Methanomassiliicoccaceae archaeon COG_1]|nr:polyprenyl synthetase family protein [Methanomassiliicoccaceae archaeon COG_1]
MTGGWHSCISSELGRVEAVLHDIVRSDNDQLTEMCHYVLGNHGKRIRPALAILSFYACGGGEPSRAIDIGTALELVHNATLIHDDINDRGEMRRGAKALYRQYSIGKSIVAGDYLFALGFQLLGATSKEIVGYVIDAATAMGAGEFAQKKYERNVAVDEDQYMRIIQGKTAHLMECAAKCGAFVADPDDLLKVESVGRFAYEVGQAFQIVDDILDMTGDGAATGKKPGNDLVEGKPTLPTIYAMQDPKYGPRVREIFTDPGTGYDEAAEAIELIRRTGSIERCLAKASAMVDGALGQIEFAQGSGYRDALEDMARYVVSRDR